MFVEGKGAALSLFPSFLGGGLFLLALTQLGPSCFFVFLLNRQKDANYLNHDTEAYKTVKNKNKNKLMNDRQMHIRACFTCRHQMLRFAFFVLVSFLKHALQSDQTTWHRFLLEHIFHCCAYSSQNHKWHLATLGKINYVCICTHTLCIVTCQGKWYAKLSYKYHLQHAQRKKHLMNTTNKRLCLLHTCMHLLFPSCIFCPCLVIYEHVRACAYLLFCVQSFRLHNKPLQRFWIFHTTVTVNEDYGHAKQY